ncbi:MAG TPA: hypothetical protein VE570_09480, partial [Thermoleophilaceae bacterium]|nr:hypothetical protein [Thermoleophilaceae bacterium]
MTFRGRLLLVALVSLAVGLAALVVVGNVVLSVRTQSETANVLKARADAQVAALKISRRGIRVR